MCYSMFSRRQVWRRVFSRANIRPEYECSDLKTSMLNNSLEINNPVISDCSDSRSLIENKYNSINDDVQSLCNDDTSDTEGSNESILHICGSVSSIDIYSIEECKIPYEDKGKGNISKFEPKKKVIFNPLIQVCFISSRKEIGPSIRDLFWRVEDYECFKQDAVNEIRMYWRLMGNTTKDAIQALYQPEFENSLVNQILVSNTKDSTVDLAALNYSDYSSTEDISAVVYNTEGIDNIAMKHVSSLANLRDENVTIDSSSDSDTSTYVPTSSEILYDIDVEGLDLDLI